MFDFPQNLYEMLNGGYFALACDFLFSPEYSNISLNMLLYKTHSLFMCLPQTEISYFRRNLLKEFIGSLE